jgi:hypothetical protein
MGLKMMIGSEGIVRGNGNLVHMEYVVSIIRNAVIKKYDMMDG